MNSWAIVIYGSTGDLAKKYLWQSTKELVDKNITSKTDVYGIANRPRITEEFTKIVESASGGSNWWSNINYLAGNHDEVACQLKNQLLDKKYDKILIILATSPDYYASVINSFIESKLFLGLEQTHNIKPAILIEKPFDKSLDHAISLSKRIAKLDKDQLYLIDHYLAKPGLRYLLQTNAFKDAKLDNVFKIELSFFETLDVDDRLDYYDQVGAWLDVGQNHLMQMLLASLIKLLGKEYTVVNKLKIIESLGINTKYPVWRGQYKGYSAGLNQPS